MEKITVVGQPLMLHGGIAKLTKAQATARSHCITPLDKKKGLYLLSGETHFKVGEKLSYSADCQIEEPEEGDKDAK